MILITNKKNKGWLVSVREYGDRILECLNVKMTQGRNLWREVLCSKALPLSESSMGIDAMFECGIFFFHT